ncbi:MAG: hypothetical protein H6883_09890 [Rhodobiaceae bacterium]|nr:hypothetical protein [Rhodobiaceae bacterium]MCC0056438.1 hypothetical protein [Rhodobiaceae bacterium]
MVLRLIREHAWAPRILVYYLRALGIILLIRALFHWMSVLGMNSWFSTAFLDMEMPWRIMTVYFAALDAIAAVGLWFGAVWGVAGFLFAAVTEVVMHLVFPDMFGTHQTAVVFDFVAVIVYVLLAWWAGTPENIGELLRLPPE